MLQYRGINNSYILENDAFADGGEGKVFNVVGNKGIIAKIYKSPTKELENKLLYMSRHKPNDVLNCVAWPLDLLYKNNNFVGFIMPRIEAGTELETIYKYNPGSAQELSYLQRIIIAINICKVIASVHKEGFIFGDFNPANIGVNLKNGNVGFFDSDSFHIYDKSTNRTYRCSVCLDGYVAPELIRRCKNSTYAEAPLPTFTKETDDFSLAIHVFKLLCNGYSPFNGIKDTCTLSSGSPGLGNAAIERDSYCYKEGYKPLSLATPDKSSFPIYIQNLFDSAFINGRKDPSQRPTPKEWEDGLRRYCQELKKCSCNGKHYYYKNLKICPYCLTERKYKDNLNNATNNCKTYNSLHSNRNYVASNSYAASSPNPVIGNTITYQNNKKVNKASVSKKNITKSNWSLWAIYILVGFVTGPIWSDYFIRGLSEILNTDIQISTSHIFLAIAGIIAGIIAGVFVESKFISPKKSWKWYFGSLLVPLVTAIVAVLIVVIIVGILISLAIGIVITVLAIIISFES